MFSVHLVVADHYMSPPIPELDVRYSEFRGTEVRQVPVIRIFGSTIMGKKTCLHIHGVFPYVYIPYEGSGPHERLMYQIASSLDKALNISLGKAKSAVQHVYKIVLVSGLPFYGFHTKEHQYFKIYFYNPLMVKKATELLQSGAILNKMYQAHEAHIPYILQFMIDYNLYGMNLVNLENVKFRRDPENPGCSEHLSQEMLLPENVTRISTCEIEVDGMAADITNKRTITDELVVNPGLAAIWEDEKQRRREEGRTSQITPQSSQGRPFVASTESETFFKKKLHEKLLLLNSQISDSSSPLSNTPDITRTPYPAETPENSGLVEASFLDVHVQSSGSGSFIKNEQMEQNNDASFVDEDLVLSLSSSQKEAGAAHDSVVLGSQDVVLAEILHGLDNSVDVDEDSVLGSQVPQELGSEAGHGSDDEDMQDLSHALDDGASNFYTADVLQRGNLNRLTNQQDNSLWEDTFWDSVNQAIPQLDGTDDIPDMPQRRRLGIRGKLFSKKTMHKPAVNCSVTAVIRSDVSSWTVNSLKKLCNGVAVCKSVECTVSVSPEEEGVHVDQANSTEITSNSRNPEGAADVETEHENDIIRSSLMVVSDDSNGCITMDAIEASSEYVPVTTNDLMINAKNDTSPIGTVNVDASIEINPVELDTLLLASESDDNTVDVGSMRPVSQDCVSSEYSLAALTVVHEGSVHDVTSEMVGSECLKIASEDLLEIPEGRTICNAVEDMLTHPDINPHNYALSKVCRVSDSQCIKCMDSESGNLAPKGICSGFVSFCPTDESSNSEINFKSVCVVCCNTHSALCTSDGSVHDLHLITSGSSSEVNGQYCEQFRQAVLIGDPSFTAQPSSSDADNDLQVSELFSNGNISSTWLSSEQSSETSKSLYPSDIGADLLAQYDAQTVQEISLINNPFSCRTSRRNNSSGPKQKSGTCNGLTKSRRMMTRNSKVEYTSNNKTEKPRVKHNAGTAFTVQTKVTERVPKVHMLSRLSSNTDNVEKDVSFPTVSEYPLDIFPTEVKRIESILMKGNMDEIIQLEDNSMNDDVSSLNEVENSRELLDSYVQKTRGKMNRHRASANKDAVGKKHAEGIHLPVGNGTERSGVTLQARSVLAKLVCQNNNTLTKPSMLPASRLPSVTVHSDKCARHSDGIRSEKLARRLQREKRKRLSLSYRRKTASHVSEQRNKRVTNCITSGESTADKSAETCSSSLRNIQCLDKQKTSKGSIGADQSAPILDAEQPKGLSPSIGSVRIQEHSATPTECVDKDISNNLKQNDRNRRLRHRGRVEGGMVSTVCSSDQNVENMAGCKVYCDSVRRRNRNGNTVPVIRLGSYRLRSSSSQRQKELQTHDIVLTPDGLSDKSHFQSDESGSSVCNSVKRPLTSCLSESQVPDLGQHLSKHANSTNRRVQETCVVQLSKISCIPETVKPVDSKENPKKCDQLNNACLGIQLFDDGCKNYLGSCIKTTVEPNSECRLPTEIQFISDVNSHFKEEAQCKGYENSHHMKSQRKVLRKSYLCNAADTCIRQCYVKLVRLEHTAEEIMTGPCRTELKLKRKKISAHSPHFKNNVLKCSSSKTHGNVNRISSSRCWHVVDCEGHKKLCATSNGRMKAESHKSNTQLKNNHLLSSRHRTQVSGMVTRSISRLGMRGSGMATQLNIKELSVSIPALDNMLNTSLYGDTTTKTRDDIKCSENNVLYVSMTSERFPSNVMHGSIEGFIDNERSDVCSGSSHVSTRSKNKNMFRHLTLQTCGTVNANPQHKPEPFLEESENAVLLTQGESATDCVQIEHRKHLRRKTGDVSNCRSKKLLNRLHRCKLNLLDKVRPFSIILERLDQSIIEKYSVSVCNVTSRTKPQKRTKFLWQEMIGTGNNSLNINSDGHWGGRGKLKRTHYNKIPSLDGAFETSSSDDSSESKSTDHFRQLEKSPVPKKARWPEEIMKKVENNFPGQQHENANCSDNSSLMGTPLKESHFGTPVKNLECKNMHSSCETCSTGQSPRKSLYPPLAVKIQKSPKKRSVNIEDKFNESCSLKSESSKSVRRISAYKNRRNKKGQSSSLSGEEVKETGPKHVAVKQKFTIDQAHQHPKGMCDILQKGERKSLIPVSPTWCLHMATEFSGTSSNVCHDAGAEDDQQDTFAEEHICSFHAAKGGNVHKEENRPVDIVRSFNVGGCECGKNSKCETTSVPSNCSFPLRTEMKMDRVSEVCVRPQSSDGADVKSVDDLPTVDGTEGWTEKRLDEWVESDPLSKIVRKQSKTPFLGSHSENKPEVGARESDSDCTSQGSLKVSANKAETNKSSASFRIDFPERKKIVRERQNVDVLHTEKNVSCKAFSLTTDDVEGNLLHGGLTKAEVCKISGENANGVQTSQSSLCERMESPRNCSSHDNASTVCNRSAGKVQQPAAEDSYSLSNAGEDDEGIVSFYDETTFLSPAMPCQFKDSLVKFSTPDDGSSKRAVDLEYVLLTHTEQDSSEVIPETCVNSMNCTPTNEQSCKRGSCLRTITTANKNYKVYAPKFNPPSKDDILASLSEFCIPEYRHQGPFVSNVCDAGNKKEVGNKVLKICSTSVHELQPFVGSLLNIVDIETWRRKWLQEINCTSQGSLDHFSDLNLGSIKPALTSHRKVVITPCKLPPSVNEVKLWCEMTQKLTLQNLQENGVEDKVCGRNVMIPLSPGQEPGSDDDMSLSPLTPRGVCVEGGATGSLAAIHSTPQCGSSSRYLPSPPCTPIHNTRHKIAKMLLKHSRKGQKWNSPNQENVSPTLPFIREEPEGTETGNDAANGSPTTSHNSAPACWRDASGLYKRQGSEDLDVAEPAQLTNLVDQQPSSEVPGEGKCVDNLQLHDHIPAMPTNWRTVKQANSSCQIEESTPNNTYGFRMSFENLHEVKAICEHQFLTTFIMELHIQTRGDLRPDPAYDAIRALFYVVENDVPESAGVSKHELGIIVVSNLDGSVNIPVIRGTAENCKITYVEDETSLVHELVKCVRKWDPDILGGYEVEMLSWGYLFHRAYTLQINLFPLVSRVPTASTGNRHPENESAVSISVEEIKLTGRIMLNIWRLMRHEVALQSYTFESVMYHVLHQRVPLHSFKDLTFWWEHRTHLYRWICVEYYLLRVQGILKLLDQLDLIGRTSELARLFGIQFLEVLSRGSQFRVESIMLRLAKPRNYVPVSPSIQQRARMRAPEFLPLIMEPHSRFYSDPVIVLDFQSLYPSIIIAYNYCFSTCLGRVENLGQATPFVFGCTQLKVSPARLMKLENSISISPCGVAFVNSGIRKGVLPQMLQEILDTRLMVKQSMKRHKSNKTLQRVLHSRQLGLKLIANVTYGYTAANFSGRMPCSEVGDSVVSKARETLERAIHLVEATPRWGAEVVYGDTDSLFVLVPGKSREQAFKIGAEIAEAVTLDNPKPVKLKLEKVYQPCILQTKKRYVGYMYESPDQEAPVYDAKGIETVRRDGCPAVAKILEKSLRIVFETKDVSLVKNYVCRQFAKLLQGRLNIQDLIFAREYRGMSGYRPGACVPALELARRWLQADRRAEPRQRERVPYIIVNGPPGLPLIRLVRSPHELLTDPSLRPNATYYITRVIIPPLDRCFSLLGAEVESWYADMPRKFVTSLPTSVPSGLKKSTISQYFATMNCAVCNQLTNSGICLSCQQQPERVAVVLANKIRTWERTYSNITKVCQSCCGRPEGIECISFDCPVMFRRNQSARDLQQAPFIRSLQEQYLTF